ncbi:MAG TPA: hypothetical protein VJJ82_05255, partial [Candidatus Nanoarchaeia archaeon]|nr:hypothetical protein [Candidatus Nanoarchaeia archaeon]
MKRGRQSFYKISQQNETLLNQWCEDWRIGKNVSQTKGGREEVTIQNNYQRLKTICAFAEQKFKITDITKITEQQILEIFHDMDVGKFKKPNGKPYTTIANFQSRFKVFWGWWRKKNRKETGKDIPDITQDLLPERHRPDFTYLTKDEIEKLTNKANHDYKNLIWFYFDSGVRPQEGKKVLIKDIQVDDKNNCVWLNVRDEIAKKGKLWYRSRG